MTAREWTKAEEQRLRELHRRGMCDKEIALALGRTMQSAARKRQSLGLGSNIYRMWSDADIALVRSCMERGLNYAAAATRLGRSNESVRAMYRDLRKGKRRGGRKIAGAVRGERYIVLPSDREEACNRLRDATISAIARYGNDNGLDISRAATRLLSMGVA